MRVAWPTFLVIGAYKAGSTTLHHLLGAHPDVFVPERKEPSYFAFVGLSDAEIAANPIAPLAVTDRSAYERLFDGAGGSTAVGEVSPEYLKSPHAAANIADALPQASLIAVLRNPVERAYSDFLMYRRDGREPLDDFEAALDAQDGRRARGEPTGQYVVTGFYGEQLRRYHDRFGAGSVKVVLTEDLAADRDGVLADLYAHIGVDPAYRPPDVGDLNRSGVPSSPLVGAAYAARRRLAPVARRIVPAAVKRRVDAALQDRLVRPELAPSARRRLEDVYRADVELTGDLIGRDLRHWLTA